MPTPAIQTLLTDAQQVLNLNSLSEVRATMAAALANANVGTPLNPNLTTQQLWDEFYLIVRQPESDIESIIANQLMKFLFAPTLPSATITGNLTVDTNTFFVDSTNNTVGIGNATPPTGVSNTDIGLTLGAAGVVRSVLLGMQNCFGRIRERDATNNLAITTNIGATGTIDDNTRSSWKIRIGSGNDNYVLQRAGIGSSTFNDLLAIDSAGACVWSDGAGGTRMTLNSTGLLVGRTSRIITETISSTGFAIFGSATNQAMIGEASGNIFVGSFSNHPFRIRTNNVEVAQFDTSGNFLSYLTATPPTLATNGAIVFNLTSNTNLRISVRGTDGTTRVANITLA